MKKAPERFLYCVGAQKAGTSWLAEQLRFHPDVAMPPIKEIRYFDSLYLHSFEKVQEKKIAALTSKLKSIRAEPTGISFDKIEKLRWFANYSLVSKEGFNDDWYVSLFSSLDRSKLICDVSPDYSLLLEDGVRHMRRCIPNAKILFIMRNPIDRIWSGTVYALRNAINKDVASVSRERIRKAAFSTLQLRFSNYRRTITVYESIFGKENVHFLFYDDLRRDPLSFLSKFCDSMSLDFKPEWFSKIEREVNLGPKVPKDMLLMREIAERQMKQLEWLHKRFGSPIEQWLSETEKLMLSE